MHPWLFRLSGVRMTEAAQCLLLHSAQKHAEAALSSRSQQDAQHVARVHDRPKRWSSSISCDSAHHAHSLRSGVVATLDGWRCSCLVLRARLRGHVADSSPHCDHSLFSEEETPYSAPHVSCVCTYQLSSHSPFIPSKEQITPHSFMTPRYLPRSSSHLFRSGIPSSFW